MRRLPFVVLLAGALALSACDTGGSDPADAGASDSAAATSGTAANGGGNTGGLSCDGVTTGGYGVHRDARLTVEPDVDVVPLVADTDEIVFTDSGYTEGVSYGWQLAYVDGDKAFAQHGAPFFDSDGDTFRLQGPLAPIGVDGGPYPGLLIVTATTSEGTVELAQVCVALAKEE